MAWGVRAAQMGKTRLLAILLGLTILGGAGFMVVKTIEYRTKWVHGLFIGSRNDFYRDAAETTTKEKVAKLEEEELHIEEPNAKAPLVTKVRARSGRPQRRHTRRRDDQGPNITPPACPPRRWRSIPPRKRRTCPTRELHTQDRHRVLQRSSRSTS